jgi:hypothetical protein
MKKALFGIIICLALFSLVLTGCDELLGALKGKKVEGVSIPSTLTVGVNKTKPLTATITPSDADNKKVTWESDDENIAMVSSSGRVRGIAPGKTTIIVTTDDGSFTAECEVTVKAAGDNDDLGDDLVETTFTINNIPPQAIGQDYYFSVFPPGSRFEDLPNSEPLGYTKGTITGSTLTGSIYSEKSLNGGYVGGVLVGSQSAPVYVGYGNITITGGKASIGISTFTDATADYIEYQSSNPNGGKDPGTSGQNQTTITVTSIPSQSKGQRYQFAVFPSGTQLEDMLNAEPLAYTDGTITGSTLTATIHSEKSLSGRYVGVVLVGSESDPVYVGYGNITITGGKASINISAFTEITDDYMEYLSSNPIGGEDTSGVATITVTGIPTDLLGKNCQLIVFPSGTSVNDIYTTTFPLASGWVETIPSNTTIINIYSHAEEGKTPWNAANGSYLVEIMIGYMATGRPIDCLGYATVNLVNKTATIGFSQFTDVTGKPVGPDETYPDDQPGDGGTGGEESYPAGVATLIFTGE